MYARGPPQAAICAFLEDLSCRELPGSLLPGSLRAGREAQNRAYSAPARYVSVPTPGLEWGGEGCRWFKIATGGEGGDARLAGPVVGPPMIAEGTSAMPFRPRREVEGKGLSIVL